MTDGDGTYVLPNLPLGPYRLEVALQGFRTYVQIRIVLQVGASPVVNAVLSVGTLEESVTVQGAAPLVDVQSSGISDVVQNEAILALASSMGHPCASNLRKRFSARPPAHEGGHGRTASRGGRARRQVPSRD